MFSFCVDDTVIVNIIKPNYFTYKLRYMYQSKINIPRYVHHNLRCKISGY